MRRLLSTRVVAPGVLILVALALWEAAVRLMAVPPYLLPTPSDIAHEITSKPQLLFEHGMTTFQEILLGFIAGTAAAVLLALSMSRWHLVRLALHPLLIASQTFPKEALAPLFIIWFGFGISSKVVVTAIICFFPICVTTLRGLDAVDPLALDLFRVYHAEPRQILFGLRLPTALPYLFAGLRIGATLSVIGAVVGEFVGASRGLGHLIRIANFQMSTALTNRSING
jgi:NitT/TauT family transport system permease protein